jgi:hypothetical protein
MSKSKAVKQAHWRKRLFKGQRPHVREATQDDLGILWANHNAGDGGLSAKQYNDQVISQLALYQGMFMIEDENPAFDGVGPVAFVGIFSDGWKVDPRIEFFKWASPLNILRASVSLFHYFKTSRDVGVCVVSGTKQERKFFNRMKKYGALYPVHMLPYGTPQGHEFVFYVKGRKHGD